jgi:hypothetical protein
MLVYRVKAFLLKSKQITSYEVNVICEISDFNHFTLV